MVVIGVIGTIGFKKVHRQDFHWTYLFIFWFWEKENKGIHFLLGITVPNLLKSCLWTYEWKKPVTDLLSKLFELWVWRILCGNSPIAKNQLRAILKRYFVFARVKQINGIDNDQYWSGRVKFLDLLPQRLCWWFTWLELLVKALLNVNLCNWSTWCYVS